MKVFSFCLLLISCALLMSASHAAPHNLKLGLKTTVRLPASCYCQKVKTQKKGKCFYFTDKKTYRCSSRDCKPGYECASKRTNILCMRRKATSKIVEFRPGTCTEKPINLWQYVPYTLGGVKPSVSETSYPSATVSPIPSSSSSSSASPSISETPSPSTSPTASTSEIPSPTPSTSEIPSPSASTSEIPSPTPSTSEIPSPSASTSEIPSPTPSSSKIPSPSPSTSEIPSTTPSTSEIPSATPSTSEIPSPAPSSFEIPSASASTSETPSPTASTSEIPSTTPSSSKIPSASASTSETPSPTASTSEIPSPSPSTSELPSPSPTTSAIPSPSPTSSQTPLPSASSCPVSCPTCFTQRPDCTCVRSNEPHCNPCATGGSKKAGDDYCRQIDNNWKCCPKTSKCRKKGTGPFALALSSYNAETQFVCSDSCGTMCLRKGTGIDAEQPGACVLPTALPVDDPTRNPPDEVDTIPACGQLISKGFSSYTQTESTTTTGTSGKNKK